MRILIPKRPAHVKTPLERAHERDVTAAARTTPFFWTQQKKFRNSLGTGLQTEVVANGSVTVVRTYQDLKSEVIQAAASEQWDGYDLDGTLAKGSGKFKPGVIGEPVKSVVRLVKLAIRRGDNPKIFTARVANDPDGKERKVINEWALKHIGQTIPITNKKDEYMRDLYDDRAKPIKHNKGIAAYGTSEGVKKEWDSRGRGMGKVLNQVVEQNHSEEEVRSRLKELSKSGKGVWVASVEPFGGKTRYYNYQSISKVPDHFLGQTSVRERGVASKGELKSFTKAQLIREQNRGFNADK